MGKIKIKALGSEDEEILKAKEKEKREQKKLREKFKSKSFDKSLKEIPMVNLERKAKKEAVLEAFKEPVAKKVIQEIKPVEEEKPKKVKEVSKEEHKPTEPKKRSQAYKNAAKLVDRNKLYPVKEAVELVKQTSFSKFVGTVEAHINLKEKGVKVSLTFPHGTGKERKVVLISDEIISELTAGKINFDVLVATPDFMPKLAKFAKILGPKGLMPNPKAGTVTVSPEKIIKELKAGRTDLKPEAAAPIIHTIIGKADFKSEDLAENLEKLIEAIGVINIKSLFVKATMGPSIRVAL